MPLPLFAQKNPNYLVEIKKRISNSGGLGFNSTSTNTAGGLGETSPNWDSIIGTIPEELHMQVSSQYEAKIASFFQDNLSSTTLGAISAYKTFAGAAPYLQGLTQQIWIDTEPFEINLTLNFDAETDAWKDVMEPTIKLMSWVQPTSSGDLMIESPAPTVYNPEKNRMVLFIGRAMMIPSVIIPSAPVTYVGLPDKNGNFIAATAEVTLKSILTPNREDLLSFFGKGDGAILRDTGRPAGSLTPSLFENQIGAFLTSLGMPFSP